MLVGGVVLGGGVLFLLLLLDDAASSHDVEASLGFGDDLPVLVLFETDVFLLEVLLHGLVAFVDRLGLHVVVEALGVDQSGDVLLRTLHHTHLCATVELTSRAGLFCPFSLVGDWVRDVGYVLFSIVVYSFGLFLGCGVEWEFRLVADVVIGGEFSEEIFFPEPIEVGVFQSIYSCKTISRFHLEQLFEKVQPLGRQLAQVPLIDGLEVVYVWKLHS